MILNADGWMATAGHIIQIGLKTADDAPKVAAHRAAIADAESDPKLSPGGRKRALRDLAYKADPKWITNHSYWKHSRLLPRRSFLQHELQGIELVSKPLGATSLFEMRHGLGLYVCRS